MRTMRSSLALSSLIIPVALGACQESAAQRWSEKYDSVNWTERPVLAGVRSEQLGVAEPTQLGTSIDESRQAAIAILQEAATVDDPLLRAHAIEGLQAEPIIVEPIARQALVDENIGVRFTAAMTIGQLRLGESAHLLEPLLRDDSPSVRAAAIYGLHRNGRNVDLTPLARMLASEDPVTRANAALVLGELDEPSAAHMIQATLGKGMRLASPARIKIVELQMAEALVKLGYQGAIEPIRAALFVPLEQAEISALACLICGRLKDRGAVDYLNQLATGEGASRRPPELRMAAAMGLAMINPDRASIDVPRDYVNHDQYQLREQAAITLGVMRDPRLLPVLRQLLADNHPNVQVAAAGAILQIGPAGGT